MGGIIPTNATFHGRIQRAARRVNDQIRELFMGLSRQVLQIANNAAANGEVSSGNSNHPLTDFLGLIFQDLIEKMYRGGFIGVSNFLKLITPLKI